MGRDTVHKERDIYIHLYGKCMDAQTLGLNRWRNGEIGKRLVTKWNINMRENIWLHVILWEIYAQIYGNYMGNMRERYALI